MSEEQNTSMEHAESWRQWALDRAIQVVTANGGTGRDVIALAGQFLNFVAGPRDEHGA